MRVGTLSYATDQGLGILCKSFYDHGVVTDVMIMKHHKRINHYEWYPSTTLVLEAHNRPFKDGGVKNFLKSVDVMLFFETPFDWELIPLCRVLGVRTVIVPMYECTPRVIPHQPNKWIAPSLLDQKYFPGSRYLPIPVNVKWKYRETARVFVHNAGNLGLRYRNGTYELLQALRYVNSPIQLIVRSQEPLPFPVPTDSRLKVEVGTFEHEELYEVGDVSIRPEKFNGLSLPMQESFAAGMLVMASDRFPTNTYLPGPFIPVSRYQRASVGGSFMEMDEAIIEPEAIAQKIDQWFDREIGQFSLQGKEYAEKMSWDVLKNVWLEELQC